MADTQSTLVDVTAAISSLREKYLARLPDELAVIAALAERLDEAAIDRVLADELHHRLHKLSGSGSTFGLHKLSESARHLEKLVYGWLPGSPISASARKDFIEDVAALHATLAEAAHAYNVPIAVARSGAAAGRAMHIWLVEDDAVLGQELAQLLGQFGYDVRLFTRLDQAEAALLTPSSRPNAMIMDVMFHEEGLNATEFMISHPDFRIETCPLLFISAHQDFHSQVQAARLGALAFMRKPVDITHLVSMLEQILDEYTAEPSRVLIVDDDETLSEHFRLVLTAAGMEISVVNQPEKVMGEIAVFRPNIVLLDMHMPGYSGSELATVIRYHEEWLGLPIVYLSAETDLDEQIMAMGKGADDFITKPISDTQLVAMVRGRARRSKQLNDLMSKDSLTGLLKHALIKEEINMAVNRARRSNTVLSVVMADIDLFKRVNDTYGHAAGDQVLRAIAHLLRQRLRKTDVIGRYGGEEFAAVLPDCDEATARGIMEDIRIRFASLRFQHEGEEFSCTFSAGIACSAGQQDCSANGLLGAADEALYRAKRGGRNQVCIANVTDKTIQG